MRLTTTLLTGVLLALSGAAAAQTITPTLAPAQTPQERAQAEAAAVRARAAAALQARSEAEAAAKTGGPRMTAPMASAQLIYGDYSCIQNALDATKRMQFIPRGVIQLNNNGTYRYLDGNTTGRYTYDAATRQITWLTGYFAEHAPAKTTFSIADKAGQLDIELRTGTGTQNWSCGCAKK
ncbi:hypothetical protein [Hymenobacter jeollabukensis]|uniref:Uncharacterized protein n=1 Tax=Hymenobacter jeollabukensis TaxID=2025313 RepID=A0A5R8WVR0_9BACT|nr:hypothetical protein [Hymenobacter jeollabukensis]TLM96588.1 hypothetical protein FDY95_00920 [Hymenobacter jeollabukensis]